ncbi:DUF4157 domain-containing protein [Kordia sp. YSTF-M3]|uniref:DUF4157 domain-containing protein n=1 Tax=Kordia aestuariivivens TaxID=2759037 RepID=A0ABR7QCL8_9FLAO|nr:DUF4157 domain-containing protein [Kordia aestuariivivens]MBC8756317.1 DUF4157 domain-containing protein [Kordia aestuariivivens]
MKGKKINSNEEKGVHQIIQRKEGKSFVKPKGAQDSFTPPTQQKGLPNALQSNMETSLGQDFSNVAIHTNSQKATQMNARAYTQGENVHFAPGEFNPNSSKGQNLIGHEFTHVAQQRAGVVKPTKVLQKGVAINDNQSLEREADSMGSKAVKGEIVSKYRGAKASSASTMQGKKSDNNLSENLTSALSPEQQQSAVAQFTLTKDLKTALKADAISVAAIIDLIRAAPVAERSVAVVKNSVLKLIREKVSGVEASTIISELLVGSQNWANPPNTDFYSYFVLNNGNGKLPVLANMNCWESILYAAYLANRIDANWIRSYYVSAGAIPKATVSPVPKLWAQLNYSTSLPELDSSDASNRPAVGDLIFYMIPDLSVPAHVAVYIGGDEVISLWTKPNGISSIQRIPITAISGTLFYSPPPW